jgi:hypothetical protein
MRHLRIALYDVTSGTADEAQHAVELIAEWVRENVADRVKLREEHTGDIAWDESP